MCKNLLLCTSLFYFPLRLLFILNYKNLSEFFFFIWFYNIIFPCNTGFNDMELFFLNCVHVKNMKHFPGILILKLIKFLLCISWKGFISKLPLRKYNCLIGLRIISILIFKKNLDKSFE